MDWPFMAPTGPASPPPPGWLDAAVRRIGELLPRSEKDWRRAMAESMWEDRPSDDPRDAVDRLLVGDDEA